MFSCDYCCQPAPAGATSTPCMICDVVAHASCILSAASAIEQTRASSPLDREVNRVSNPMVADLRPESPGSFLYGEESGALSGGGSGDDGGDGCEAGHTRCRGWVCDHCTRERLLQISEREAAAREERDRPRSRGHHYKQHEPEHYNMLDGVVLFQAKWRGMKARRMLDERRYKNYFRAWSLEVIDVDGLPGDSGIVDGYEAQVHLPASGPSRASYQVVVTVIQDLSHVGIKDSSPPVQMFRFDTPTSPASALGAGPMHLAGVTKLGSMRSTITRSLAALSKPRSMRSSVGTTSSSTSGSGIVQLNSEMFVPGTKPWTTLVLTVIKTAGTSQEHTPHAANERSRPLPAKEGQGGTAAASATAAPAEFVGQAFLNLKNDLCRGTSRTLRLPLSPQQFQVEDFRMQTMVDYVVPEGLTISATLTPLSDVTSKCGFIHVAFCSGSANGPVGRPSKYFALLVGSMLLLYCKACSRKPPKARLSLKGASVWAKTALLQVFVSLRTPDDMGRTNFQMIAPSLDELKAWRSRLVAASSDDVPSDVVARRWIQHAGRNHESLRRRLNLKDADRKSQTSQMRLMLTR